MGFDIRMPIGALFSVLGLLLCIYGAITSGSTIYALHSLGLNVNLWWGLVMFLFGVGMLSLTRLRGTRRLDGRNSAIGESPKRPRSQ
jgi:membrane protein implicated in regulation of membrane protease activity